MKKVILSLLVLTCSYLSKAQYVQNDSLKGFDLAKVVTEGHQRNLIPVDLKAFIINAKKSYINQKYHLEPKKKLDDSPSKFGTGYAQSIPCINEGFESSPTGTLANSSSWQVQQSSTYKSLCSSTPIAWITNTTAVAVYTTPLNDPVCGTVGPSPFAGNKVVKINNTMFQYAKVKNNFPVSPSNWLFTYAYVGALAQAHNGCCDDGYLCFQFYDCSNNLIPALSQTIVMGTPSCVTTSTANWSVSTTSVTSVGENYTPNWQLVTKNLSAYINTCLYFEAIAAPCLTAAHPGYMYLDVDCSAGAIIANGTYLSPASVYTSCALQASLSAITGFSNYVWQGPAASGVSGSTTSAITTGVAGNYTVTATSGTFSSTQTLNLIMAPAQAPISITGNTAICPGSASTLQVTGQGLSSFLWNNGSTFQTASFNPINTTTYSVMVTNTSGCLYPASQVVSVFTVPTLTISSTPSVCSGQTASLSANLSGIVSYTWDTGATGSGITISPTITSVRTVTGTTTNGCQTSSSSATITVYPFPQLLITPTSPSLCMGQSAVLSATAPTGSTYTWSTGSNAAAISVTPASTSVYQLTVTSVNGCSSNDFNAVTVHALPQVSIAPGTNSLCIGQTAALTASSPSGSNYSWSNGSTTATISVSPTLNTVYQVTVTTSVGCMGFDSRTITIHPIPQIQVISSNTEICVGNAANLSVTGTNFVSVIWNNAATGPSTSVSPTINSVFTATATSALGCSASNNLAIIVNQLPQLQISSSSPSICAGKIATLTANASNIVSYLWSDNQLSATILVVPLVTSQYSIVVTDTKGCQSTASLQMEVITCTYTSIEENYPGRKKLEVFPNPSDGTFEIKGYQTEKILLVNELGQILSEFYLNPDNDYSYKVSNLAKGVYFVSGSKTWDKIIVK